MSGGILSRWARRKQAVRAAEQPIVAREVALPAPLPEDAPDPAAAPSPEEADALAEAIARLPRLEDLTADTDLAPFLRAGIPSVLRNAALRRMWSMDAGIRDFVSEAREYAYDWNTPGGVPGLGPMLPTDDIEAMVQRITAGPAPTRDAPEAEGPEPESDPGTQATVAHTVDAADPPDDEPTPTLAHADTPAAIPLAEPAETFQSPTIVSRLRRHGGAMPR